MGSNPRFTMQLHLLLLLLNVVSISCADICKSRAFTQSGECCKMCGPGEGVVQRCGVNQTVCEACMDSVTYSDDFSHTAPCKPCTECTGLKRMFIPCMESEDTKCQCTYGYFMNSKGQCKPCTKCNKGYGLMFACTKTQDTVCEECPDGTYSDEDSITEPCMPCTLCEDDENMTKNCTKVSDSECASTNPNPSDRIHQATTDILTTPITSSGPITSPGTAENLIPVYCSILAAVVVGLVAFIAFKGWNNCKQKKQAANNRTVNQTPSPEGEKLHSDSGISVGSNGDNHTMDSHSLHDQQHQTQVVVKVDSGLYTTLPPHKQEEVEKLLDNSEEDVFRNLASLLGYKSDHIDNFSQDDHPVRALLSDWSSKDTSTMDTLYNALKKIQRDDIVDTLNSDSTATSAL
ncbi:tumor necrosis factor receptor superfamily member 16 isoform X2 [Protopterus annectens]|uniref:tumor necrosis factor receptor superfamily member 16 isoform X2 n=1 Tax=Protopterus annectens TaxID=7888 RepID=UPI001CF955B8|nr:tumor necrosis factor receptor superfamily member 16 isoform X2 [Protopterus annectens]